MNARSRANDVKLTVIDKHKQSQIRYVDISTHLERENKEEPMSEIWSQEC